MIGKLRIILGLLILVWALSACGTIEVSLADEDEPDELSVADLDGDSMSISADEPTPATPATDTPQATMTATPEPQTPTPVEVLTPTVFAEDGPAGWQRFYDSDSGMELWYPPGTTALLGELSRPVFSSVEYPDGIVEEQVFVVRVMQDEGGPFGPPGPQAILEVKLVANAEQKQVGIMAEEYSKRCPGQASESLQPTTVNVQLGGFRYSCEGIDGIIFNEFWAPHPTDPTLLFGAVWADMSAPLSDQILATVAFVN